MKSDVLADIVKYIHYSLFIVVFSGPFLPIKYIPYYILFVLAIFLDWNDLDGMCILTKLEYYFRKGKWSSDAPIDGGPEFFRPMVSKIGINLTRSEADRLNNFIFLVFLSAAFIRFVWLENKCDVPKVKLRNSKEQCFMIRRRMLVQVVVVSAMILDQSQVDQHR